MDRFKAPTAADEMASCQSCGERFHYTALDDDGFCSECRPEKQPMTTAIFSFGQTHVHFVNGAMFDKNSLVRITSPDPRQTMFDTFGPKWSMQYTEEEAQKALHYYPRGIIDLET